MTRMFLALAALAACATVHAQSGGRPQYISDEITVSIREQPRLDAGTVGVVRSGARVTLLESLGPESFARIRTADGRTGWVTARFLSSEPAAREQLGAARQELQEARARIQSLERELQQAREQLAKAKPAFELQQDNERLRASIRQLEEQRAEQQRSYDLEKARRRTLVTGASLVGAGIVLGLILPWLGRGKRRRYSEL